MNRPGTARGNWAWRLRARRRSTPAPIARPPRATLCATYDRVRASGVKRHLITPAAAARAPIGREPALVQGRDHLRGARALVLRQQRRRHRRLPRPDVEARLPAGPGRHRDLAAAVLSVAAARRRLRHRRLHRRPSRGTARCDDFELFLRARRTRAACASSPSWCSTTRPTSIRGSSARAARRPGASSATSTSGATRPSSYTRGAHHLQGLRAVELGWDPVARPTTGTASTPTSPI